MQQVALWAGEATLFDHTFDPLAKSSILLLPLAADAYMIHRQASEFCKDLHGCTARY